MIVHDAQRRAMFANMNGGNQFAYTPVYSGADIGAMGTDAVGAGGSGLLSGVELGAAVLPPVLLGAGLVWGADKLRGSDNVEKLFGPQKKTLIGKPIKSKKKNGERASDLEAAMRGPILK